MDWALQTVWSPPFDLGLMMAAGLAGCMPPALPMAPQTLRVLARLSERYVAKWGPARASVPSSQTGANREHNVDAATHSAPPPA